MGNRIYKERESNINSGRAADALRKLDHIMESNLVSLKMEKIRYNGKKLKFQNPYSDDQVYLLIRNLAIPLVSEDLQISQR